MVERSSRSSSNSQQKFMEAIKLVTFLQLQNLSLILNCTSIAFQQMF